MKEIAARKETVSALLLLMFVTAVFFSVFISPQIYQRGIHEGDIALKDVYAPYDFTYSWKINEEETSKKREEAARNAPYILVYDTVSEKKAISGVERFFAAVETEKKKDGALADKIALLKEKTPAGLSDRDLRSLLEYPKTETLERKTLDILEKIFLIGYISENDLGYLEEKGVQKIAISGKKPGAEIERPPKDLLGRKKVRDTAEDFASKELKKDRKTRQAIVDLICLYISPNLVVDESKTKAKKEEIMKDVEPEYYTWAVEKNELIIEKGKRVDARHIAQLLQLRRVFKQGITSAFFLGVLLLFVLLGLIAAVYMSFTRETEFLRDTKGVAVDLLNMFLMIVIADFIMRSPQPTYFVPLASMGMIITLFVGFNIAFLSVLLMSIFISLIIGGGIEVALVLLTGSVVGMLVVRGLRRRAQILWAGLVVGVVKFLAIACIGLVNNMGAGFYVREGIWGVASGLLSGFMVMGLLPVFEHLLKIPTNISLLELSDLNHPLLKKLAMEAPGTYHHSIMVGNLAEAACDSIGANSLLARVGAYYHDIGKTQKPEYFSENEMGSGSRHSKLAPSMSALIISKHVKHGAEIAKKYKLNNAIIDFITQHHGDSLISYFYQKAIEESESGTVLREENFRYPGPKPQTKEGAIILLADAVEASSRSLKEPAPSSIKHLVKKIINNKFIDGQLDECDLTLKDMNSIADSFVRVLMGVFHARLDYPEETKKTTNGIPTNDDKNKLRKPKQKKKD